MKPNDAEQPDPSATPEAGGYATLSDADQRAVDLLIEHGFDLEAACRAHPADAPRVRAAHALFVRANDRYSVEPPDPALVDATLARIDRAETERAERMTIGPRGTPTLGRGRWADFIAVACVAVLAVSIGLPLLNSLGRQREIAGCQANLAQLGSALAAYHGDFNSRPITAGFAPDFGSRESWDGYDNSKHLDALHLNNYCPPGCLHCAKDTEGSGYASQVPNERLNRLWLTQSHLPLVADRNPLVLHTALGGRAFVRAVENSPDHDGRGQNVLYGDLAVIFEVSPLLPVRLSDESGPIPENIWIPADRGGLEDSLHAPREWSAIDVFLLQ